MSLRTDRALLELAALPVDNWGPEHWAMLEAIRRDLASAVRAARRRVDRAEAAAAAGRRNASGLRRSPIRPVSPRRAAETAERVAVREYVLDRDRECIPARRGMPGRCETYPGRASLEVHEIAARGTHPGSHLDRDLCVATCPKHHDDITDATGDLLALARDLDLRRRPTT